jgi:hypothetical protein
VKAAHAPVALRALADQLIAAIQGVVDYHDHFPVQAGERLVERVQQRRDVLPLAECRHHDREIRQARTRQSFGRLIPAFDA